MTEQPGGPPPYEAQDLGMTQEEEDAITNEGFANGRHGALSVKCKFFFRCDLRAMLGRPRVLGLTMYHVEKYLAVCQPLHSHVHHMSANTVVSFFVPKNIEGLGEVLPGHPSWFLGKARNCDKRLEKGTSSRSSQRLAHARPCCCG